MMWKIIILSLFTVISIQAALSQNVGIIDETPYDEWSESPTVYLRGCGEFPAVRVIVNDGELESRGFLHQNHTFLPARETLQRLGGIVIWSREERAFYAQFPQHDRTFRIESGSPIANVYTHRMDVQYGIGDFIERLNLGTTPIHCEGRIFAPIRAAVESVGGTVHHDTETGFVHISDVTLQEGGGDQ